VIHPVSFARRVRLGLWLGGAVAAALALVGVPPGPPPLDAGLLAHLSGLLAGYLAAVMMLLIARTPVLERRVGPDVLARWHSAGGRLFLGLVLTHAGAAVAALGRGPTAGPGLRGGPGQGPWVLLPDSEPEFIDVSTRPNIMGDI
jgi:hypothetical protein